MRYLLLVGAITDLRDLRAAFARAWVRSYRRGYGPADTRRGGVMSYARQLLETHPSPASIDREALIACIEACFDCAQSCTACADACLAEEDVEAVVRCIRRCQDCSDVCGVTGRVLSRQTEPEPGVVRALVEACAAACGACAEECEAHAGHHDHCAVCAQACRRCEEACKALLAVLAA
jgi:hypothetical protein